MTPADLQAISDLLPAPVSDVEQLGGPGRPWRVRYGGSHAVLRRNDPGRFRSFGQSDELALASITWLHDVLRDLAEVGFVAPAPITDLRGRSIAIVDNAIWELLSYVPGRSMGWTDDEMHSAGALLATLHDSSLALAPRPQRPGSHPLNDCRPSHPDARAVRIAFERELEDIGHDGATRAVIHGDATQSNVVIDDRGAYRLVDFALAYSEALLADLGSALWRNGRSGPDAVTYDPARAARFVQGYATIRPLAPSAGRAIVIYMKGRGLQLQQRLEMRHGTDETVLQRLLAINIQQRELQAAITTALDDLMAR